MWMCNDQISYKLLFVRGLPVKPNVNRCNRVQVTNSEESEGYNTPINVFGQLFANLLTTMMTLICQLNLLLLCEYIVNMIESLVLANKYTIAILI
ncbi:hypothetical protein BLOT_007763 [Blomia tropicalis]|nr:hypothetical protein BLOT_007763 [Blomia tropicalis]